MIERTMTGVGPYAAESEKKLKIPLNCAPDCCSAGVPVRVQLLKQGIERRLNKRCNATCAQQLRPCLSAPAQASTRRCTHAVRRPAQQLLHVHNRAAGSSFNSEQAVAVAARASRRHFDGVRRKCGACAAGGRGRRLHSTNYIPSAARAGVGGQCGTQSTQNDHGACLIRMEGSDDRRLNKEMGSGSSGSGAMQAGTGGQRRA